MPVKKMPSFARLKQSLRKVIKKKISKPVKRQVLEKKVSPPRPAIKPTAITKRLLTAEGWRRRQQDS